MDTTLRDGEQTSGVSFYAAEKLTVAQLLLEEAKVDRIEIASAKVSSGELEAVKRITKWADEHGYLKKVEILTFIDGEQSLNWVIESGAKVINILSKGSLNHLTNQLKKTPEQHFENIREVVAIAHKNEMDVNIYLEDWSNGMTNSPEYVFQHLDFTTKLGLKRIMLPDTLGVLTPSKTYEYISQIIKKYPETHFDFHAHNDYDLSVANVMEAIKAGAKGIHLTANGLGERAGNAPLASTIAVVKDFMPEYTLGVDEKALYKISKLVEGYSGIRIPQNKPIVGESVFTQTAGIHADGDKKKNLYVTNLSPDRFGRKTTYALGKLSGKANIEQNLKQLGITLNDDELKKVTQKIIELGDKKEQVTREDLPFIIADVLDRNPVTENIQLINYTLAHTKGLKPTSLIKIQIEDKVYEESAQGDGQYDAFMNALKQVFKKIDKKLPQLTDYQVRIPPGGMTDALCETIITWNIGGKEMKTRGLDSDQTISAIEATLKMLNIATF
ncbi:MAG: alpha-isopropylmalate synthase regulatory domain-containing protein [Leadbetterella sp.]